MWKQKWLQQKFSKCQEILLINIIILLIDYQNYNSCSIKQLNIKSEHLKIQ